VLPGQRLHGALQDGDARSLPAVLLLQRGGHDALVVH
jgi:hypothetical protein